MVSALLAYVVKIGLGIDIKLVGMVGDAKNSQIRPILNKPGALTQIPFLFFPLFIFRYSSKNYGLVMSGQAMAAPVVAILTQVLNPLIGWFGMFLIIAGFSLACAILQCQFPRCPSPRAILDRLSMTPSQL